MTGWRLPRNEDSRDAVRSCIFARMKPAELSRLRLAAQQLIAPPETTPHDIVARLGAVQSQDWFGGTWGIGMRGRGIDLAAVERAMHDGAILRTHVLRPTWHFVAPADIRWMIALTGPRVMAGMGGRHRQLEIDEATIRRARTVLERVLAGGRTLTRGEIGDAMRAARIDPGGQRLPHLLMVAELEGLLCSGPRKGKQFTWALLEERVAPPPASAPATRDEMLEELARRYFTTRGPATAHDFAWWSGLTVGDARRGAELAGDALARVEIDGVAHWLDASLRDVASTRQTLAHLLPNYDEYFIGHRDRSAMLARLHKAGRDVENVALSGHLLAIDGQVVGHWTRATSARAVVVEASPLLDLPAAQWKAIDLAARALGAFLGVPASVARPVPA